MSSSKSPVSPKPVTATAEASVEDSVSEEVSSTLTPVSVEDPFFESVAASPEASAVAIQVVKASVFRHAPESEERLITRTSPAVPTEFVIVDPSDETPVPSPYDPLRTFKMS